MLEGGKEGERREETNDGEMKRKEGEEEGKKEGRREGRRGRRAEGSVCTSVISYSCSHMVAETPGQNLSVGECTYTFNCYSTVNTHLYYCDHRPGGRVSTYNLQGDHISACWKTYMYSIGKMHILVYCGPCTVTHSLCGVVWFVKIAGSSSVVCSLLKWPNTNLVLWVTLQKSIHML